MKNFFFALIFIFFAHAASAQNEEALNTLDDTTYVIRDTEHNSCAARYHSDYFYKKFGAGHIIMDFYVRIYVKVVNGRITESGIIREGEIMDSHDPNAAINGQPVVILFPAKSPSVSLDIPQGTTDGYYFFEEEGYLESLKKHTDTLIFL